MVMVFGVSDSKICVPSAPRTYARTENVISAMDVGIFSTDMAIIYRPPMPCARSAAPIPEMLVYAFLQTVSSSV